MKLKKIILASLLCFSSFHAYAYHNSDFRMTYQKDFSNENNLNNSTAMNLCESALYDIAKENNHVVSNDDKNIYHNRCLNIKINSSIFYSNIEYFNKLYGNNSNLTLDEIKDKFLLNYIFIKYNANNNILYHNNYEYIDTIIYAETHGTFCYGPCSPVYSYEIFDKYHLENVL